jgi:hypothetical protein
MRCCELGRMKMIALEPVLNKKQITHKLKAKESLAAETFAKGV